MKTPPGHNYYDLNQFVGLISGNLLFDTLPEAL
jgi:hypothetical protein